MCIKSVSSVMAMSPYFVLYQWNHFNYFVHNIIINNIIRIKIIQLNILIIGSQVGRSAWLYLKQSFTISLVEEGNSDIFKGKIITNTILKKSTITTYITCR